MGLQARTVELRELARREGVVEMFVVAVAFLAYVSTLAFGFVYDDRTMVQSCMAPHVWPRILSSFIERSHPGAGSWIVAYYYRPVTVSAENILLTIGGGSAMFYHLIEVLMHAAASVLFYRVAKRLWGFGLVSAAAAFFFALHPAHVQALAWSASISDPLVGLFSMAALASGLRWLETRRAAWLPVSLLAGVVALLSKETAVVLPVVVLAVAWAHPESRAFGRRLWLLAGSHLLLALAYLGLRSYMIRPLASATTSAATAPGAVAGPIWLSWPEASLFYLRQLLALSPISPVYPIDRLNRADADHFYAPLVMLAVCLAIFLYWLRRVDNRRRALACVVWTLAPLAPVFAGMPHFVDGQMVAERYLYFASGGFCLLAAAGLCWLAGRLPMGERRESGAATLLIVVALLLGASTVVNQQYWASDILLFRHALEVSPGDPTALLNFGTALCEKKRYKEGRYVYAQLLSIDPTRGSAWYNYGLSLYEQGAYAASEPYFLRAIEHSAPPEASQWSHLIGAQLKQGKTDVAEQNLTLALSLLPNDSQLRELAGFIALTRHQPAAARLAFEQALRLSPGAADAQYGLQQAEQMLRQSGQ